jgi:2-oxoisovalerate dehydrogenase E1 component
MLTAYERMLLVRRAEERLGDEFAAGNLPGSVHLYIGQEATAVGVCAHLADTDYVTSTHRGHGHFLAKGGDLDAMFAEIWGKREGVCGGMGGSMHVADVSRGILGANGIVGAGLAIAAGAAWGAQLDARSGGAPGVAVCFFGDGAANQGVLSETLNVAAIWQLPMVFVCENNTFSEFTPSREVTAGRVSDRARPFGVPVLEVDGNDLEEVWRAAGEAVDRARSGGGPTFIEAHTYRIRGHMEREKFILGEGGYRNDEEIDQWIAKDPIARLAARLVEQGVADDAALAAIDQRVIERVDGAVDFAVAGSAPDPDAALRLMFADDPEPPAEQGEVVAGSTRQRLIGAITNGLAEEMERDPKVIVFGEDVELSIMGDTRGLLDRFGRDRVRNTPICEATLTGMAVGLAAAGYRPVLHMMFSNFLYTGMDAIGNQMSKLRLMTGGQLRLPITMIAGCGGGRSSAAQHSDSPYPAVMNLGGINVAAPATPADAKGLLKAAIRGNNPTLFLEPSGRGGDSGEVPDGDHLVTLGSASVVRAGSDVTVVAIGRMVKTALRAASTLSDQGVEVELIDPRTLVPFDHETVLKSVLRTGRLVVVDEARSTCSAASEIAAVVGERAFSALAAPVRRITTPDVAMPYAPGSERFVIPDEARIVDTVVELMQYSTAEVR